MKILYYNSIQDFFLFLFFFFFLGGGGGGNFFLFFIIGTGCPKHLLWLLLRCTGPRQGVSRKCTSGMQVAIKFPQSNDPKGLSASKRCWTLDLLMAPNVWMHQRGVKPWTFWWPQRFEYVPKRCWTFDFVGSIPPWPRPSPLGPPLEIIRVLEN